MKGVVLAAGEGTRMAPLTDDRPKPLVEVGNRPLLAHPFETLIDVGVTELVVVVGHRAAEVIERFGDDYDGVPITYVHQREQKGLAHALLQAGPHVEEDFLVMNGDNVSRANLDAVVERHRSTGADATAQIHEVSLEAATETATYEFDGEDVVGLVEKPDEPPSRFVSRGFFAFSPVLLHACELVQPSARGEYELSDAIDLLIAAGRQVETVELEGWCVNVNEPADIDEVERRLE